LFAIITLKFSFLNITFSGEFRKIIFFNAEIFYFIICCSNGFSAMEHKTMYQIHVFVFKFLWTNLISNYKFIPPFVALLLLVNLTTSTSKFPNQQYSLLHLHINCIPNKFKTGCQSWNQTIKPLSISIFIAELASPEKNHFIAAFISSGYY
jgi:hypothetical protein